MTATFAALCFFILAPDDSYPESGQPDRRRRIDGGSYKVEVKASVLPPDASLRVYRADELSQSSPSLPGVPVAIPGLPAETASGGVKAPQYFAPGVAGDHGESIAQYIRIGDYLFPNNLPANVHGNGYADPGLLIPAVVGALTQDAGAFDVRHGNHAENLAVAYELRPRLSPFLQLSADARNYDLSTGSSFTANPQAFGFVCIQIGVGDGYLALPERRRQYKVNAMRAFTLTRHRVTLFGAGYYGYSRLPGLVPIDIPVPGDTIDTRQSDRTRTLLFVAADTWHISSRSEAQFSVFARSYDIALTSNFGDGLIRQSERRTVTGGNAAYQRRSNSRFGLHAGLDWRQDVARDSQLSRLDAGESMQPVTWNDFTIRTASPYAQVGGELFSILSYSAGVRRDQVGFSVTDKLLPEGSYTSHAGVTSPRGSVMLRLPERMRLPVMALSYGRAFHTNDPRIPPFAGTRTAVAVSTSWQAVATQHVGRIELRLALSRVSNSNQLAKLDADTGLPEDVGPSLVRSLTLTARRGFAFGWLQASFGRATATNPVSRENIPEAPRLIWSVAGSSHRLPWGLHASGYFDYVGRKPLGDGFTAAPVRILRGSLVRKFMDGALEAGLRCQLADGYTGQTVQTLALSHETDPAARIVGFRQPSYFAAHFSYRFGKRL